MASIRDTWQSMFYEYTLYIRNINKNTMNKRNYKQLTVKERARIAKDRLLNPEDEYKNFWDKHNITFYAIKEIEKKLNFSKEVAAGWLLSSILEKDNDLISLSTDIKQRFAEQIWNKKRIENKDIETLDKIENTAMKRAAMFKAAEDAKEAEKPMDIQITL